MPKNTSQWEGFLPKKAIVMAKKGKSKKTSTEVVFETTSSQTIHSLDALSITLQGCKLCKLCSTRTQIVVGEGHPKAKLVFVGEAPGEQEDLTGRPFVGRAGQLLTKMIEAMGLKREDVYICNVVKCRPPQNRNPEPDEIASCSPFLKQQLAILKPQVIVALGKFSAQTLLATETPIGQLRGNFHTYEGIPFMPTFHPSYLLRNPSAKKEVWEDLKKVAQKMGIQIPKKTGGVS